MLALFMALSTSLSMGISGRYDLAVVVARDSRESAALVALSVWTSGVLCALLLGGVLIGQDLLRSALNAGSLGVWLLATPIALFLSALGMTLRYHANSKKKYSDLSRMTVYQALIAAALSIALGALGWGAHGLLTASMVSLVFAAAYLMNRYRDSLRAIPWRWSPDMWRLAGRYREYPLINAPTSLLDGVMLWMPVFFLTKYFTETAVGHYALLTRVATAPLTVIAGAVSQVNLREMAERVHDGRDATGYLRKLTFAMVAIVLPPTILFMAAGPSLFAFVFGEQWRTAGELLAILMPSLALRFVVSPLSGALVSTGHVRLSGIWQVLAFVVTLIMFALVAPQASLRGMIVAILINDICLYSLYYAFIIYAVMRPKVV
ncbi:MAG: oligosaccharide flippase family protein [Acidobacteria bacterium]|nr:oligosaccharide flippase family protein [Acidobacteriota bacterium]